MPCAKVKKNTMEIRDGGDDAYDRRPPPPHEVQTRGGDLGQTGPSETRVRWR